MHRLTDATSASGPREAHTPAPLRESGDVVISSTHPAQARASNLGVPDELDQLVPMERSWRLNERHYGALQGLTRRKQQRSTAPRRPHLGAAATTSRHRRCISDERIPRTPAYDSLRPEIAGTESLKDTRGVSALLERRDRAGDHTRQRVLKSPTQRLRGCQTPEGSRTKLSPISTSRGHSARV